MTLWASVTGLYAFKTSVPRIAEQGKAYVWRVKEDATLERVAVQTGAFGDSSVPILKGLQADDWVVLAGVQMLHENQSVRAVDRDNRPVELAAQE